jgi:hypothetical protein
MVKRLDHGFPQFESEDRWRLSIEPHWLLASKAGFMVARAVLRIVGAEGA